MSLNFLNPSEGFLLHIGLDQLLKIAHHCLYGLAHAYMTSFFQHKTLIPSLEIWPCVFSAWSVYGYILLPFGDTQPLNKAFL